MNNRDTTPRMPEATPSEAEDLAKRAVSEYLNTRRMADATNLANEAQPLPEPAGFRTRYRSEPGMIGSYPWAYADQGRRRIERPSCEYEDLFTADQVRAAVAAERARIAASLRRSGATLPAPEVKGTPESGIITGLCIALTLVEDGPNEKGNRPA